MMNWIQFLGAVIVFVFGLVIAFDLISYLRWRKSLVRIPVDIIDYSKPRRIELH